MVPMYRGLFQEYTGEEYWSTADGVQDIHDLYCKKFLSKQVTIGGKTETYPWHKQAEYLGNDKLHGKREG